MTNQNITMDYSKSAIDNQELAVMPASLAKKLLVMLASQLTDLTSKGIIGNHMDELRRCDTVEQSVKVSIDYVNTRTLIANIQANDWDFYKIEPEVVHLPETEVNSGMKINPLEVFNNTNNPYTRKVKVVGKINLD